MTTLPPTLAIPMAILLSTDTASLGMDTEADTENMGTHRLAYVDMDVLTVVLMDIDRMTTHLKIYFI